MATAPKRIGCCCVGSGCNGEKALIQKDLALFKKNLEHRPKTCVLIFYSVTLSTQECAASPRIGLSDEVLQIR